MSVNVATPEFDSPAARALIAEGVAYVEETLCEGEYGYGQMFAELWDYGQPFVIVEWDIIPWPGAVDKLLACQNPWCSHRYPLHPGQITVSYGIGKYRPDGPAPQEWLETPWDRLDGAISPVVQQRCSPQVCLHEPPVAHARRNFGVGEPREA